MIFHSYVNFYQRVYVATCNSPQLPHFSDTPWVYPSGNKHGNEQFIEIRIYFGHSPLKPCLIYPLAGYLPRFYHIVLIRFSIFSRSFSFCFPYFPYFPIVFWYFVQIFPSLHRGYLRLQFRSPWSRPVSWTWVLASASCDLTDELRWLIRWLRKGMW